MLKKQSKKLAIMLILSMVASLFVGVGTASAANGVAVSVSRVVTAEDDAGLTQLGNLQIKEDSDYKDAIVSGDTFVITLPTNVKWNKAEYTDGVVENAEISISGNYTMTVKVTDADADAKDTVIIPLYVNIDKPEAGYVYATIDGLDSPVPSGDYAIAQILSGGTTATVTDSFTAGPDTQTKFTARLTETTIGTFAGANDKIKLTLPKKVEFTEVKVVGLGGATGTANMSAGIEDNKCIFTMDELKAAGISFDKDATGRAILQFECKVDVASDCKEGAVEMYIEGNDVVDDATVTVGKVVEFGTSVYAEDAETVLAGKVCQEMGTLVIYENVADTINSNRSIKVELPDGVKFSNTIEEKDIKVTKGNADITLTDADESSFTFKVTNNNTTSRIKIEVDFDSMNIAADFVGDVVVAVSGRAGVEGEVTIGTVVPAVEVAVDTVADVKIGFQGQAIGTVTIAETEAGALVEDGVVTMFFKEAGLSFDDKSVKVDVTEGNLEVTDVTTKNGVVTFTIDSESTTAQPSVITITGIFAKVDRTVAEGPVKAVVCGSAVVQSYEKIDEDFLEDACEYDIEDGQDVEDFLFEEDEAARFVIANCVTPGVGEVVNGASTATSTFVIGSTAAVINGADVTLPVAPYIANSRTLCPVRYIAYACGITESNVIWNPDNRTVTLISANGTVVQLTIGSTTMLVNGVAVAMDVAPEITDGYTFLPARYVANAFGFDAAWEAATKTVTITPVA